MDELIDKKFYNSCTQFGSSIKQISEIVNNEQHDVSNSTHQKAGTN
jgi:hypothetical protein